MRVVRQKLVCGPRNTTRGAEVRGAEFYAGRGKASVLGRMLCACRGVLAGRFVRDLVFPHSFDGYLVFGPVSL